MGDDFLSAIFSPEKNENRFENNDKDFHRVRNSFWKFQNTFSTRFFENNEENFCEI